jgi:hypothetical protein
MQAYEQDALVNRFPRIDRNRHPLFDEHTRARGSTTTLELAGSQAW